MNSFSTQNISDLRFRPALENDLAWISGLQQKLYSANDAVPLAKLKEWFHANPNGFFILENAKKEALGQITFLPLTPECFEQYRMEGENGLIEREILGRHLQPSDDDDSISVLYLESLILPDANRPEARLALMRTLPEMIAKICCASGPGNIFALAATDAGERWLTKMGLVKISRAEARRDGHDMFQASVGDFLIRAEANQSKSGA